MDRTMNIYFTTTDQWIESIYDSYSNTIKYCRLMGAPGHCIAARSNMRSVGGLYVQVCGPNYAAKSHDSSWRVTWWHAALSRQHTWSVSRARSGQPGITWCNARGVTWDPREVPQWDYSSGVSIGLYWYCNDCYIWAARMCCTTLDYRAEVL